MVEDFERDFARYCNTSHCIGVGSGTQALRLALIAAGVTLGDVVVTVPNSFVETAEAICQAGALPDFVDIDDRTYTMDPTKLQEHLETLCYVNQATGKLFHKKSHRPVTAVVPVHLYGQMADMDRILEIAEKYDLIVVEDASQAHGAGYFSNREGCWKKAGSIGNAAAFSFNPQKNLGAWEEAGVVTTNDRELAHKVRRLRDHGQTGQFYHDPEGCSTGLDAIQAELLRIKLKHLADWNKKRRENAFCYHGLLASTFDSVTIPYEPSWARAIYHLYVIRVDNRDRLKSYMAAANIATKVHYPVALYRQKAFGALGYKRGDFPITEKVTSEILSLPMYPQLEFDQQYRVARRVSEFVLPSGRLGHSQMWATGGRSPVGDSRVNRNGEILHEAHSSKSEH